MGRGVLLQVIQSALAACTLGSDFRGAFGVLFLPGLRRGFFGANTPRKFWQHFAGAVSQILRPCIVRCGCFFHKMPGTDGARGLTV